MMVMFDLPVGTKRERKAATGFRNFLLDRGFEMSQFSIYVRFCAGKEQAETQTKYIRENLPQSGQVNILYFTDKQYENMESFRGRKREPTNRNPSQYVMF